MQEQHGVDDHDVQGRLELQEVLQHGRSIKSLHWKPGSSPCQALPLPCQALGLHVPRGLEASLRWWECHPVQPMRGQVLRTSGKA